MSLLKLIKTRKKSLFSIIKYISKSAINAIIHIKNLFFLLHF